MHVRVAVAVRCLQAMVKSQRSDLFSTLLYSSGPSSFITPFTIPHLHNILILPRLCDVAVFVMQNLYIFSSNDIENYLINTNINIDINVDIFKCQYIADYLYIRSR